jgi:quinohemoprotein ethanol dehydrogenase
MADGRRLAILIAAFVAGVAGGNAAFPAAALPRTAVPPPAGGGAKRPDTGAGQVWTAVGGAADESSYSRLDQINTRTVEKLGLAWSLDLPGEVTLEATPLEVDGRIYFTGSLAKVYAVDAQRGAVEWTYDPQVWKSNPDKLHFSFGANRGMAYEDGKVFAAALDGRLFALDAKSGKQLWTADSIPAGRLNVSTGAPRAMSGKVIIGNGGADFGSRGFVTTFDSATGKQLWRFYTTPGSAEQNKGDPAMEAAARTWGPDFWRHTGGGGTVWNGMTYDAELNRVYLGTGNSGPYDPNARDPGGGDDLYNVSIVALDADSGRYIWHYQENPRDCWDYKSTPNIVMATVAIHGSPRKVLLHAPTNGFFYVLDRETGKLLNEPGKTTEVSWAKSIDQETGRPVEVPDIRYETGETELWPGSVGGHNWQAMSYNPTTGLAYIPIQQIGERFSRRRSSENGFNVMGLSVEPFLGRRGDGHGYLVAWNPVTQKQAWRVQHKGLWNGGTLTTAGRLVFQGTATGSFAAFDAQTGKQLWQFAAGLGIVAAPMSYSIDGRQYVSILVGYGGAAAAQGRFMDMGYKFGKQPRRLLTFALGADKKLPPASLPDFTVHALDNPSLTLNESDVDAGRALSVQCAACHGVGLQATGAPAPDLRESAVALNLDSLSAVLKSGALLPQGMPRFQNLTDEQIGQLYVYIRARAREALGKRKENNAAPHPALGVRGRATHARRLMSRRPPPPLTPI